MFKFWIIYYWLGIKLRGKFSSRRKLLNYQQKKLKKFQKKVLRNSPYYQALMKEGYDIDSFPIIGKKEFVESFDQINTVGIKAVEAFEFAIKAEKDREFSGELNGITVGLSSGTSGNRSLFLASAKERAKWAANVFSRVVSPKFLQKQKVAFILRADSNLYSSVSSSAFKFHFLHLATPLPDLIKELNVYQPDILSAQPSLMILLAQAKRSDQLKISPKQLISYAEVLDEMDRRQIEEAFGKIITEVYQCTEGFLGHSCKHGNIRLHEDLVRFEKEYIAPGKFQPIVTDFSRSSQPVVRYKMNDILEEMEESCPCGSPMICLKRIEGRMDEVLEFTDEAGEIRRIFPDFLRRSLIMADGGIENYQIVQSSPTELEIYLEGSKMDFFESKERVSKAYKELFTSYQLPEIELKFFASVPPKHALDKMKRIVSLKSQRKRAKV
ncbi:MAG: F390 synthetase-related protein [Bacteroidota bacterium]